MTVVCGTDFSIGADHAVRVACVFARSFAERLVLVHAVEEDLAAGAAAAHASAAQARLEEVARSLRGDGLEVATRIETGTPDEKLSEVAEQCEASAVVVGFLGRRSAERWRAGSLPARLARTTPAPLVVVRDAECFEAMERGQRALRVLVAADFSLASDAAVGWLDSLRRLGACEATLLHTYDPVREWSRFGVAGRASLDGSAQIETALVRDLGERIAGITSRDAISIRVIPSIEWTAETIANVAERERFDVVVVGGPRRRGLARIAHDSVSERLFSLAPASVVRVPIAVASRARSAPRMARLLVPTDLSDLANDAVRYAYSIAAVGSTVHLLHVVEDAATPNPLYAHYIPSRHLTEAERVALEQTVETTLRTLIPEDAERRGIETRTHVVRDGRRPADVIRIFAEQIGADAICIGTHGRSGLSRIFGGSVARELADTSSRPLLLIHPAVAE